MIRWWRRRHAIGRHRRWRDRYAERVLRYTPTVVIEYPIELFVVVWGLFTGPSLLIGNPGSRAFEQIPDVVQLLLAALLITAALTVGGGLWRRSYGTFVASGMALAGTVLVVDAGLIYTYGGPFFRWPSFVMLFGIGLLLHWRALWLRARDSLHRTIAREAAR